MTHMVWRLVGLFGQAVFASRFIVQWLTSEHRRESVIPLYFWYASIFGAVFLLAYAIYIKDPVFILGQSFGFIVYARNLVLLRRRRLAVEDA